MGYTLVAKTKTPEANLKRHMSSNVNYTAYFSSQTALLQASNPTFSTSQGRERRHLVWA